MRVYLHEQDTLLIIPGQTEPFRHTDRNRLRKLAEPRQSDNAAQYTWRKYRLSQTRQEKPERSVKSQ